MPELPEVEAARRVVERVAVGRRIVAVWCAADPIVFARVRPDRLRAALLGRRVQAADRHGKHFWLELDRRPWLTIHFGMSGELHTSSGRAVKLMSSRRRDPDTAWPPSFTKLVLELEGGARLAVADARRLGRIRLRDDPRREPPISELGFDALDQLPPARRFTDLVRARRAPVKAVLLDQSFAAGVGNWIADEVLYQARIDPRRRADTLSDEEARRLRAKLRFVIGTAVRANADSDRYPRQWLFHARWERRGEALTRRREKIRLDTIGGRTTAWVPAVQR
jgi:formamidopyrimidine-DNA glycosylase